MDKLELFQAILDEEQLLSQGVFALSLVDKPANKTMWVKMAEENFSTTIKLQDEEKRIITSAVLIPGQLIMREESGKKFNIVFDEETVEKTSQLFMKKALQNSATIQHIGSIDGITFTELWLVDDPINDKANSLGFKVSKGTWMVSAKIENDEIWDKYIETGKLNGFSIEGFFSFKKVELSDEETLEQVRTLLSSVNLTDKILAEIKDIL